MIRQQSRFDEGYDEGYQDGIADGMDDGYVEGHADGYDDGLADGYDQGLYDMDVKRREDIEKLRSEARVLKLMLELYRYIPLQKDT